MIIIETTDNRFYIVRETGNPDLDHVWIGTEVRLDRKNRKWVKRSSRKGGRPPVLINKKHCYRIVSPFQTIPSDFE